jgi:hypothetical protein
VIDNKRSMSTDDLWLLRLFVLIRAATEAVSAETVLAYAERHELRGITTTKIRTLLAALTRRGVIQPAKGDAHRFVATRQGRKAAAEARTRLSNLISLLDGQSSGKSSRRATLR